MGILNIEPKINIENIKNKKIKSKINYIRIIRKSDNIKRNKNIKIKNGNINNNIKIISWNKGNSLAGNRMNELKLILKRDKPEIFFINEFNLDFNQDINLVNVKGYKLELDSLYIERGIARTAAYIKQQYSLPKIK